MRPTTTIAGPVRCLECGQEYRLEPQGGEAGPCPHCGGVGWLALDRVRPAPGRREKQS